MARRYYTADAVANVGNMFMQQLSTLPDRNARRKYNDAKLANTVDNTRLREEELARQRYRDTQDWSTHEQTLAARTAEESGRNTRQDKELANNEAGRKHAGVISVASAVPDPGLRQEVISGADIMPVDLTKGSLQYTSRKAGGERAAVEGAKFQADRRRAQANINYEATLPLPGGQEGPRPPPIQLGNDQLPPKVSAQNFEQQAIIRRAESISTTLRQLNSKLITSYGMGIPTQDPMYQEIIRLLKLPPEQRIEEFSRSQILSGIAREEAASREGGRVY